MSVVNFEVQQAYVTPNQLLLALEQVIPSQTVTRAIISTSSASQRQRILPTHVVVALVIAMSFWSSDSVVSVFKNLIHGLASLRIPDRIRFKTPTSSSITEARQRTGPSVMTRLFELDINIYFSWLISEILDQKISPPQHRSNPRVVKKTRSKFKSKKRCHRNNSTPRQQLSFLIFRTVS
jgi:hypothetical protein